MTVKFDKTLVFSDFHGDLEALVKSFAHKGLLKKRATSEKLEKAIRHDLLHQGAGMAGGLVRKQKKPVRMIFLGDCLDRCEQGYHIIRFFSQVDWREKNIHPVFLMGNHDLLNFMLMVNPFQLHHLYQGNGPDYTDTLEYIRSMRIEETLKGFVELHGEELIALQREFCRRGRLTFSFPGYEVTLTYGRDYSFLDTLPVVKARFEWECLEPPRRALGIETNPNKDYASYSQWWPREHFVDYELWRLIPPDGTSRWWNLVPPDLPDEGGRPRHYGDLCHANMIHRGIGKKDVEVFPIDWRVMSAVWRKYYGDYFKNARMVFLENGTLYAHGGLSPSAMIDPMIFGNLYRVLENTFKEPERGMTLGVQVNRANRIAAQVIGNSLRDYSFEEMCGAEVLDLMGWWRGCRPGFPAFGGPLWADFEFLQRCVDHESRKEPMLRFYKNFCQTYGVKRVVCGHTPVGAYRGEGDLLFKKIPQLEEHAGLEYICIDNGCSRAYRRDFPAINGIEIDAGGTLISEPSANGNTSE